MSNLGAMGVLFTPDMDKILFRKGNRDIISVPCEGFDSHSDSVDGTLETVKRGIFIHLCLNLEAEQGTWLDKDGLAIHKPKKALTDTTDQDNPIDVFFYRFLRLPTSQLDTRAIWVPGDKVVARTPGSSIQWSHQVHEAVLKLLK